MEQHFGEQIAEVNQEIHGLREEVEDLREDLEWESQQRQVAERKIETALGIARRLDDGARADGGPSKKELARNTSRNAVVRRTAEGRGSGAKTYSGKRTDVVGSVTNGEVRRMLEPDHHIAWQTVDDAWKDLVETWNGLAIDGSGEEKKLVVDDVDALETELISLVELDVDDLEEGDLAKRLVGGGD